MGLPHSQTAGDVAQPLLQSESPEQVILGERQPYGTLKWTFLVLHYFPILAQFFLMCMAALEGARLILGCTVAALAISGGFCSKVAWDTDLPGSTFLPLSRQHPRFAWPLLVPYGFLQWVIVELNFQEPRTANARSGTYKAANAIIESILTSAALLYTHWTVGLPGANLHHLWDGNGGLLLCQLVVVASGGLGLLQMDYCCSQSVRDMLYRVPHYILIHAAFRACEVASRLSILTGFAVVATFHSASWWAVMIVELGISSFLVLMHGGIRNSWIAIAICIVSSSIVNVFCFVDSPTHVESARCISFWLTAKHFVEMLFAGAVLFVVMDWKVDLSMNTFSLCTAMVTTLLYWALWAWLRLPTHSPTLTWYDCFFATVTDDNIFSASRHGNLEAVERLTTEVELVIDLDGFDVSGLTPLMHAAIGGHARICERLLARGATVNLKTIEGEGRFSWALRRVWPPAGLQWTALHMAAWKGHVSVLLRLLPRNDNWLECGDVDGNTPLHIAGKFGHGEAFWVIAENSQEWADLQNRFGQFPEDPCSGPAPLSVHTLSVHPHGAAPEGQEGLVPIIRDTGNTVRHEVPLGLPSFMVCTGSGMVGNSLLPPPLVSPCTAAFEQHQVNSRGLRIRDLRPCDKDGREVPDADPRDPDVWGDSRCKLGEGSYGVVWRACDAQGTKYAVKCIASTSIASQGHEHNVAIREVQVALAVRSHPHACLLKFHSLEQLGSHMCLLMDYCAGGTLQQYLRDLCRNRTRSSQGTVLYYTPPHMAWQWLAQVFLGLEYIHNAMHAIHRDIKPDNVGLASADGTESIRAVILDYGGCRLTGASPGHYSFGSPFPQGTPGYVSPELVNGWAYDHTTDFYSFGAMIWVVITGGYRGSVPHARRITGPRDLRDDYKLLQDRVKRPEEYRQTLPRDVQSLVLKLTQYRRFFRCNHEEVRRMLALPSLLGRALPPMEPIEEVARWVGSL